MESGRVGQLILTGLAEGLPGVTREWGAALAQAGAVCFEDQNHKNGVELKVNGTFTARYRVYWQQVTEQTLRCWGDREEATEHGAYGVAFIILLYQNKKGEHNTLHNKSVLSLIIYFLLKFITYPYSTQLLNY